MVQPLTMVRLVLGVVKGSILGAGVGYGAYRLGMGPGWNFLVYGLVGLVVGMFVGRPLWSHLFDAKSTVWTGILKGVFGFGIGVGLWALAAKVSPDPKLTLSLLEDAEKPLSHWQPVLGALVGLLYGAWVEIDDPPVKNDDGGKGKKKK